MHVRQKAHHQSPKFTVRRILDDVSLMHKRKRYNLLNVDCFVFVTLDPTGQYSQHWSLVG